MPRIRCRFDDFEVEEVPLYPPCGEGEHTFLLIEKSGIDTEAVVRDLERELRVPRLAIGYAGRKDRWAVTRQWFSLPRLDPTAALALAGQSWPSPVGAGGLACAGGGEARSQAAHGGPGGESLPDRGA